jgi:hypothetical protein
MELGDKHLKVQRASIGLTQVSGLEMSVNAMSMLAGTTSAGLEEGRVLQLLNMVTPEELTDSQMGLARSLSNLTLQNQQARLFAPWLAESLQIVLSSRRIFLR